MKEITTISLEKNRAILRIRDAEAKALELEATTKSKNNICWYVEIV